MPNDFFYCHSITVCPYFPPLLSPTLPTPQLPYSIPHPPLSLSTGPLYMFLDLPLPLMILKVFIMLVVFWAFWTCELIFYFRNFLPLFLQIVLFSHFSLYVSITYMFCTIHLLLYSCSLPTLLSLYAFMWVFPIVCLHVL